MEILIVEDDEGVASALQHALRYASVPSAITLQGPDALVTLSELEGDFAAVLVDHHLPSMSGTEVLRRVRVAYPRIVRILTTGRVTPEVRSALNDGTIERLFEKPWSADDLSNLVAWLRGRVAERSGKAPPLEPPAATR